MIFVAYFIILVFGIMAPLMIGIYGLFAIIGDIKGAPYVPTSSKMVEDILKRAQLKKGQIFMELGSGDGRVTLMAVEKFGVKGIGVDIHPLLIFYSKIISKIKKLDTQFFYADIFKTDISQAEVIFNFLLPHTLKKLVPKFKRECKKGTLIISHGFKIEGMDDLLIDKIDRKLFPTFYYRI